MNFLLINKYFKITADDFAYCNQRNKGIIQAIQNGVVNSTSVLVNGNDITTIDQKHCVLIGLHLNLTEGLPCSNIESVQSLLNNKGFFHDKISIIKLTLDGKLNITEVETEITAQIEKFIKIYGFIPFYIDGHQHVHVLPGICESMVKLMKKYCIKSARIPNEMGLSECKTIESKRMEFYQNINRFSLDIKEYVHQNKIRFPKYFIGYTTMSRDFNIETIKHALELIYHDVIKKKITVDDNCKLIEIMSHPGFSSQPGVGGCGLGPDDFALSTDREHELHILCLDDFRDLLHEYATKFDELDLKGL